MPYRPEVGENSFTAADERAFEAKAERELSGHRGLIDGRDYRWNCFRFRDSELGANKSFSSKFDETFPAAPGSPDWFSKNFCAICGKRPSMCQCGNDITPVWATRDSLVDSEQRPCEDDIHFGGTLAGTD